MKTDRWYHIEIWERDLKEPSHAFIGRLMQQESEFGLLQDQDGRWYFVWDSGLIGGLSDLDDESTPDCIEIYTESADCGDTFEELKENMRDWVDAVLEGRWPAGLFPPEKSEIGLDTSPYDN